MGSVRVCTRLPECIVKCIQEAYGARTVSEALRRFMIDAVTATMRITFPNWCEDKCFSTLLADGGREA